MECNVLCSKTEEYLIFVTKCLLMMYIYKISELAYTCTLHLRNHKVKMIDPSYYYKVSCTLLVFLTGFKTNGFCTLSILVVK